ncbi:pyridoxine/pyridoxamine 5'-phosphate oxidase [Agreia bicolorata]|uniref:pyridoxine/pyridoxamine 5'-phosphate oxidase n=1 Tax=Agreia bicolorata TaxID=110935 RepID=UPI00069813BB|nr:pyridoxamine 5'-phosphate oxidase family protein [Agreia bicolorata]
MISALPDEARDLLTEWLPDNADPARPLIVVATVDADGRPDARSVLLSEYSAEGFFFHTDSRSRKVADLESNPHAAFAIAWPAELRQLSVQGVVERASVAEERFAYARRSRYLQLLAWINSPEFALLPSAERERAWAEFDAEHPEGTLTTPPTWLGFMMRPTRLTFWEGSRSTASRRTEHRLTDEGNWAKEILPG